MGTAGVKLFLGCRKGVKTILVAAKLLCLEHYGILSLFTNLPLLCKLAQINVYWKQSFGANLQKQIPFSRGNIESIL